MYTTPPALLEECIQIFLTDSSQYLIISGGTTEERSIFLSDFSHSPPFEHTATKHETINTLKELEPLLHASATHNISVYFLDNPNNIAFDEIRRIIDVHMVDAKIILTTVSPVEGFLITNFSLPDKSTHTPIPQKTSSKKEPPSKNTSSLLDLLEDTPKYEDSSKDSEFIQSQETHIHTQDTESQHTTT